jgi:hypothetical protein
MPNLSDVYIGPFVNKEISEKYVKLAHTKIKLVSVTAAAAASCEGTIPRIIIEVSSEKHEAISRLGATNWSWSVDSVACDG